MATSIDVRTAAGLSSEQARRRLGTFGPNAALRPGSVDDRGHCRLASLGRAGVLFLTYVRLPEADRLAFKNGGQRQNRAEVNTIAGSRAVHLGEVREATWLVFRRVMFEIAVRWKATPDAIDRTCRKQGRLNPLSAVK